MRAKPGRRLVFLAAAAAAGIASARAARATRIGPQFQVNTQSSANDAEPWVARTGASGFVVVWRRSIIGTLQADVFGQRFDMNGAPSGSEFQVNTSSSAVEGAPHVAADGAGNFVVVWESRFADPLGAEIFGQRFDQAGMPVGTEFPVNTYTAGDQIEPSIAVFPGGGFVVVWASEGQDGALYGIFGQRFAANGAPLGAEFPVNSTVTGSQITPAVFATPGDGFIVVYASEGSILGQRFDAAGAPQGPEFQASVGPVATEPDVVVDAAGNATIVWVDGSSSQYDVALRRFDAAGAPLDPEQQANVLTAGCCGTPSVVLANPDVLVVGWTGSDGDQGGAFVRYFTASGAPLGPELQANTDTTGEQVGARMASLGGGEVVVAWGSDGQGGSGFGVFAQRLAPPCGDASPQPPCNDHPIAARKLVLKGSVADGRMVFISNDATFPFPALGGLDDPGHEGASVTLFSAAEGRVDFFVPAGAGAGWSAATGAVDRYRFVNRTRIANGPVIPTSDVPVTQVKLVEGKKLKIVGTSSGLPLAGSQGSVAIRVTTGSQRSCALFDAGTVARDEAGRFIGRNASAASLADCSDATLGGSPSGAFLDRS